MALALQDRFAHVTLGPAADDLAHSFAHMLDHVKVIGYDARSWQAQLDCPAEGRAHIHAHHFHSLAVGQAFEQTNDVLLLAASTHLEYLVSLQVAEDRVVALSLATSKLINPQQAWGGQRLALLDAQAALGQLDASYGLQTALHETR